MLRANSVFARIPQGHFARNVSDLCLLAVKHRCFTALLIGATALGVNPAEAFAGGRAGGTSQARPGTSSAGQRPKRPGQISPQTVSNSNQTQGDIATASATTCIPMLYGDVTNDGMRDLDDTLCLLDGFAGHFTSCAFEFVDIYPCDGGDGMINVDDLNAVLASFRGQAPCPDPCQPCVGNVSPIANAGPNLTGFAGDSISFNGAASSDVDGILVEHEWDFGDGTRSNEVSPEHMYAGVGTFTVVLAVLDSCGAVRTDSATVTITQAPCGGNRPPVAHAGSDRTTTVDANITFVGAGSSDPDNAIVSYWWNFGDGYATGWQASPAVQHSYDNPGSYVVTLWVQDVCGAVSAADEAAVLVQGGPCNANHAPSAQPGAAQVTEAGQELVFDGTQSSDSDGWITTYAWNFGDGSSGNGSVVEHDYADEGTYTVTLTVTDNCGGTNSRSTTATISSSNYVPIDPQLKGFLKGSVGTVRGVAVAPGGQKLYVASMEFGVVEFDIANPRNPRFLRTATVFQNAEGVAVNGSWIVIGGSSSTAAVCPLSAFATRDELWTSLGSTAQGIALNGNLAVVAVGLQDQNGNGGGLRVMNLLNPTTPQAFFPMSARGVALSSDGRRAYVASGAAVGGNPGGLRIIDIGVSPPRQMGALPPIGSANSGDIVLNSAGTMAYLADYSGGLRIVDVSNPTLPRHLASLDLTEPAKRITRSGNLVFVTTDGNNPKMKVIDVSNPSSPTLRGSFPGAFPDVDANGSYSFVAGGTLGLIVVDAANPAQPQNAASISTMIGNRTACATNGSLVLVSGPAIGVTDVVEVTSVPDLDEPDGVGVEVERVSQLNFGCNDIAMAGDLAYLATPNVGLKVVNVSNPVQPVILTTVNTSAKGVAVTSDGRWLFVAAQTEGVKVFDLLNPQSPALRATLDTPGSAFDVVLNESETRAFVADYAGGMQILDVSNRQLPRLLGTYATTTFGPVSWTGVVSTPDGEFAMAAGGNAQYLHVVDVSNPAAPLRVGTVPTSSSMASFAHYALIPASSYGLMVVDLYDPTHPVNHSVVRTPGSVLSAAVWGDRVFLGDSAAVVDVVDLRPQ